MSAKEIRVKDLVRLLNIVPSYAFAILSGKKGVSEENMKKIKEKYPSINFKIFTKPRYKIEKEKKEIIEVE